MSAKEEEKGSTYSVHLPFLHVVVHDAGNQVGIPPHLGIVLEVGVVEGDASLVVNAQRPTGARELRSPQVANAVIVPWMSSATPRIGSECRRAGRETTHLWT